MLDFQAVGKQIHNLRVQNGFSQDGLAEVLYVTRQAVSRWELGQTLPSVDNLAELCRLFRVSFEELLCMGRPTEFAEDDLFRGHSREFVVDGIINGKLNVKLPEVLYQFSPKERLAILKAVKERKIKTDLAELMPLLTQNERIYMGGIIKP